MANKKKATEVPQWSKNLKARFKELGKLQKDFTAKYGTEKGTVSRHVNGVQEPDPVNKKHYVEFLEVPDWNWFLSEEEREKLAQDKRAKELFENTDAYKSETDVCASQEALDGFSRAHKYLSGIGFKPVEEKLKKQGKINQIANLCFMWDSVFRSMFHSLEPLFEAFLEDCQTVEDSHREDTLSTEVDSKEQELQKIAEQYSFIIGGQFDYLYNVNLEYMRTVSLKAKNPAPKEQDKGE